MLIPLGKKDTLLSVYEIYEIAPAKRKRITATTERITSASIDLPAINLIPPNIKNIGQNLNIYVQIPHPTTPVVLRRNMKPTNIRKIAHTISLELLFILKKY